MIRTKPPSDEYRDGWERVFGDEPEKRMSPDEIAVTMKLLFRRHNDECPARDGGECTCPPP